MASGVAVRDDCKQAFTDIKLGKLFRYIIYSLTDDLKEVYVLKKAERDAKYDDFVEDMKVAETAGQCRYAVFDCEYESKGGQPRTKLAFFMWSPDCAKIKQKMVYSSSKDALKRALGEGIQKEVQANDHGDLAWENLYEILTRTDKN